MDQRQIDLFMCAFSLKALRPPRLGYFDHYLCQGLKSLEYNPDLRLTAVIPRHPRDGIG